MPYRIALKETGFFYLIACLKGLTEFRSSGEGFVVDTPRIWLLAFGGASYRLSVAALISSSSSRTPRL